MISSSVNASAAPRRHCAAPRKNARRFGAAPAAAAL
jgi:hypothetical protein